MFLAALLTLANPTGLYAQATPVYFAPDPGIAKVEINREGFSVSNAVLSMSWRVAGGGVEGVEFRDNLAHRVLPGQVLPFVLILGDGSVLPASEMRMIEAPRVVDLDANPGASRLSERVPGKEVAVDFEDERGRLHVEWQVILRDGSNYIRHQVVLSAKTEDVPLREVRLVDRNLPDAHVIGTVKGSPIVAGTLFVGFEDPLAACAVASERARCWMERELPLKAGQSVTYSSVAGVTAEGQMRRGFLHYLERERAHPYRTFLHYNSWYDMGYFSQYDEAGALDVINAFGRN